MVGRTPDTNGGIWEIVGRILTYSNISLPPLVMGPEILPLVNQSSELSPTLSLELILKKKKKAQVYWAA